MATRRTGALVQRSRPAESSTNEVDPAIDIPEEDEDESETKETRLTLMEEILLLGLKDREVWALFNGSTSNVCRVKVSWIFIAFLGLYFVLEWLYFGRTTWLHFNRVRNTRSDWLGKDGNETKRFAKSKSRSQKHYTNWRCTFRRSFEAHKGYTTFWHRSELDRIIKRLVFCYILICYICSVVQWIICKILPVKKGKYFASSLISKIFQGLCDLYCIWNYIFKKNTPNIYGSLNVIYVNGRFAIVIVELTYRSIGFESENLKLPVECSL